MGIPGKPRRRWRRQCQQFPPRHLHSRSRNRDSHSHQDHKRRTGSPRHAGARGPAREREMRQSGRHGGGGRKYDPVHRASSFRRGSQMMMGELAPRPMFRAWTGGVSNRYEVAGRGACRWQKRGDIAVVGWRYRQSSGMQFPMCPLIARVRGPVAQPDRATVS
jgi:hypothetical protein